MIELQHLEEIFDFVRIVDPNKNTITYAKGPSNFQFITHSKCYELWKRNKVCDNCISIQAVQENRKITKIELVSGRIYFVIAMPYLFSNEVCALELIIEAHDINLGEIGDNLTIDDYTKVIDRLNEFAITDELTGLFNKRYVIEHINHRHHDDTIESNVGVIMADIDHFKHINDRFGHPIGDKVLKDIGTIIKHAIRNESDWAARYGGEEFLLVLRNIHEELLFNTCERIRLAIGEHVFSYGDITFQLTISMGAIFIDSYSHGMLPDYIDLADQNLYFAKNKGRNQTQMTVYDEKNDPRR